MVLKRTLDKVIFPDAAFSQECNVIAHPRWDDVIMITEHSSLQDDDIAYCFKWQDIENFQSSSRSETISILAEKWFNPAYKINRSRFMDTNGDGTGIKNHARNYSSGWVRARIRPTNNAPLYVDCLYVHIATSSNIGDALFGSLPPLTNGLYICLEDINGNLIYDLTDGIPIQTNSDFTHLGFSVSPLDAGNGLNYVSIRLQNIYRHLQPIEPGQQLSVRMRDNFSGLTELLFYCVAFSME